MTVFPRVLRLTWCTAPKAITGAVQKRLVQEGDTMKKVIVALVFALFALGATTAFSQGNFSMRADVPFAFSINGHQYAAGPYELRTINSNTVHLFNAQTGDSGLFVM